MEMVSRISLVLLLFLTNFGVLQVIMVLAVSGCAAATAVGYVSRYGEEKMGWMAICDRVGKFCNQMMITLVFSYLAFFSYFALAVMSSNKVMYQANE